MAKYTDEQIKKALMQCKAEYSCKGCPYEAIEDCFVIRNADCLDLINRQEAEIERLSKHLWHAEVCIDELEYAYEKVGNSNSRVDEALEKYNLAKEMVGESK